MSRLPVVGACLFDKSIHIWDLTKLVRSGNLWVGERPYPTTKDKKRMAETAVS
jgi:hypothetical protein